MYGAPDCALDDEIVTMRPQPASIMSGSAAWMQANVPVRFTARIRAHVSWVMSSAASNDSMPADVTTHADRPELGPHPVEGVVHRRPVGDVDLDARARSPPCVAELGRGLLGRVAVAIEQRHRVALGGEPPGDAQPDARRRPGHDHHPARHRSRLASSVARC